MIVYSRYLPLKAAVDFLKSIDCMLPGGVDLLEAIGPQIPDDNQPA
jgi:hypothetical protein